MTRDPESQSTSSEKFGRNWSEVGASREGVRSQPGCLPQEMNPIPESSLWKPLICSIMVIFGCFLFVGCSEEPETTSTQDNSTSVLIEPNQAVGKITRGMTTQQVVAVLGAPTRNTGKALEYRNLGLAVIPETNGLVVAVMAGDVTGGGGPYVKAFKGRTKEGIGMNSTRADVVKAFGEPDNTEKFPMGVESMRYDRLGITLTLEGGKVYHMIVGLGEAAAIKERTVNLEPVPNP